MFEFKQNVLLIKHSWSSQNKRVWYKYASFIYSYYWENLNISQLLNKKNYFSILFSLVSLAIRREFSAKLKKPKSLMWSRPWGKYDFIDMVWWHHRFLMMMVWWHHTLSDMQLIPSSLWVYLTSENFQFDETWISYLIIFLNHFSVFKFKILCSSII
mgnify:CR=1 FL=1